MPIIPKTNPPKSTSPPKPKNTSPWKIMQSKYAFKDLVIPVDIILYSNEKRMRAIQVYQESVSIAQTIRTLGYPRWQTLYTWIRAEKQAPKEKSTYAYITLCARHALRPRWNLRILAIPFAHYCLLWHETHTMKWACGVKLIQGVNSNQLQPDGGATRAQAATILQRLCESIA